MFINIFCLIRIQSKPIRLRPEPWLYHAINMMFGFFYLKRASISIFYYMSFSKVSLVQGLVSETIRSGNFNPFLYWRFLDPYFKVLWERVKLNPLIFCLQGGIRSKKNARSRIFMYGLPKDILSKGEKWEGRAYGPPPKKQSQIRICNFFQPTRRGGQEGG